MTTTPTAATIDREKLLPDLQRMIKALKGRPPRPPRGSPPTSTSGSGSTPSPRSSGPSAPRRPTRSGAPTDHPDGGGLDPAPSSRAFWRTTA